MSCTDIAKYFLHFLICRGTVFAVPWYFCFGTFCPKVKARSVSAGPQTTGFGDAPQQAFWQAFLPPPGAKFRVCLEMSRNVQSGNTQNLKSMVIQRSFPKWSVAERRKTAAASNQAACCACTHSRYLAGGSPSGLRV